MKTFKGGGKFFKSKTANPAKPAVKPTIKTTQQKGRTLISKKFLKRYKLKTLKGKIGKSTKHIENVAMKGDDTDFETYLSTIKGFLVLFKNILKEQRKLDNFPNNDKQLELDIVIDDISSKLNEIETKNSILKRIKKESPEVYIKVQAMYRNINSNTKLPYHNLIEYYYEIINKLLNMLDDREIGYKVPDILTILAIDLSDVFFGKQKIEKEELEDDLSEMFSTMKVSKNAVDDLLEGLGKMKF
jgi:hypothetical protein